MQNTRNESETMTTDITAKLAAQLRIVYETLRDYTDGEETQAVGKILDETELLLSEVEK